MQEQVQEPQTTVSQTGKRRRISAKIWLILVVIAALIIIVIFIFASLGNFPPIMGMTSLVFATILSGCIGILSLLVGIIPLIHDDVQQDANTQSSTGSKDSTSYNFSGPVNFYQSSPPQSTEDANAKKQEAINKDTTLVPEFLLYNPDVLIDAKIIQQREEEGQVVPTFTYLEKQVYNYLRERAGRVCSRDEIKRAVWRDELPSDSALQKIIERIRAKIEPDTKNPQYLVAIRGQGYILNTVNSK